MHRLVRHAVELMILCMITSGCSSPSMSAGSVDLTTRCGDSTNHLQSGLSVGTTPDRVLIKVADSQTTAMFSLALPLAATEFRIETGTELFIWVQDTRSAPSPLLATTGSVLVTRVDERWSLLASDVSKIANEAGPEMQLSGTLDGVAIE